MTAELPRGEKERSGKRMTQLGKTIRACRAYMELQLVAEGMQGRCASGWNISVCGRWNSG